jgi:hypothetical protein
LRGLRDGSPDCRSGSRGRCKCTAWRWFLCISASRQHVHPHMHTFSLAAARRHITLHISLRAASCARQARTCIPDGLQLLLVLAHRRQLLLLHHLHQALLQHAAHQHLQDGLNLQVKVKQLSCAAAWQQYSLGFQCTVQLLSLAAVIPTAMRCIPVVPTRRCMTARWGSEAQQSTC